MFRKAFIVFITLSFVSPTILFAGKIPKQRKMIGVIEAVRFGDPLAEPYYIKAYIDVYDGRQKRMTFIVNDRTAMKSQAWGTGFATYLRKGRRVTVYYIELDDGTFEAKQILGKRMPNEDFK